VFIQNLTLTVNVFFVDYETYNKSMLTNVEPKTSVKFFLKTSEEISLCAVVQNLFGDGVHQKAFA
jgi:hypothetical protein